MESPLWTEGAISGFTWEREALQHLRAILPNNEPWRAWSNIEFIGDDGSINEVDLLLVTPHAFYVVAGSRPQEAIVPVAVYVRSGAAVPEGWSPIESVAPAWWEIGAVPETADVEDPDAVSSDAVPAPKKPRRAKPQPDTPVLFDQPVVPPVPPTDWIGQLLASPAFRRQPEAPGRQPMAESRIRVYLRALRRGGTMTEDALRAEVGGPPFRVRTELSTLRGLLNLDGECVLAVDCSEIRLNVDLLTIQFELGAT